MSPTAAPFDAVEVIRTKRDGAELSDDQIDWVIAAYTAGDVAEEQMSALAMAIFFRGLTRRELGRWTRAMINSGERLDFSSLSRPTATILLRGITGASSRTPSSSFRSPVSWTGMAIGSPVSTETVSGCWPPSSASSTIPYWGSPPEAKRAIRTCSP